MASPQFDTPNAVGPIRDRDAHRVCSLSGIVSAREQVTSLRQLRNGLDLSIRDLEAQRRKDQVVNKALLVARFTKASCDAFISLAADMATAFAGKLGKQAEFVEALYGSATPLAEAASASYAGQNVDWIRTGADSVKKGISVVTHNEGYRIATRSAVVKVELIKSAMNQDKEGLLKSAASYLYDLHTTLGEMAGAGKTAAFAKIAKDAFEYNEKIGQAFDDMLEGSLATEEQYRGLKTTLSHQARRLSATIDAVDKFIVSCEDELGDTPGASLAPMTLP